MQRKNTISSLISSQNEQNAGVYQKNVVVSDKRFVAKKGGLQKLHVQKLVVTEDEQLTKESSALSEQRKNYP